MSDDQNKPDVRRVGRKDRKRKLDDVDELFPPQEEELNINDIVQDVVDSLPPMPPEPEKVYTPPEERFPPIPDKNQPAPPEPKVQPAPKPGRIRREGNWRHNVVALIFAIATIALLIYFNIIWNDPYSALNPLAPPTPFVFVTETPGGFVAEPTATLPPQQATPRPLETTGQPFNVAGVIYAPNANVNGCDWSSIAGAVTGLQGEPLNGYRIQVIDAENPDALDVRVFSGSAATFGAGGFELPLGGTPAEGLYTIQLFSPAGAPLSDVYQVATRATCEENVAIVNFVQVAEL